MTEQVEPVGRIRREIVELLLADFEHIHANVAGRRGDHRARSIDGGGPCSEQDIELTRFTAPPPVYGVDVAGHAMRGGAETRQDGEAADRGDPAIEPSFNLRKRLDQRRRDWTKEFYFTGAVTRHVSLPEEDSSLRGSPGRDQDRRLGQGRRTGDVPVATVAHQAARGTAERTPEAPARSEPSPHGQRRMSARPRGVSARRAVVVSGT